MRILISMILAVLSFSVLSNESSCLLHKYEQYVRLQTDWQNDLSDLILKQYPQYQEVVQLYLDDQLILIEKRKLIVGWLLASRSNVIKTYQSVNRWSHLSDADKKHLADESDEYRRLLVRSITNKNRRPHKDNHALRQLLTKDIFPSRAYQVMYAEFSNATRKVNNRVCIADR